jgi:predicted PurR-regulated permease PerM
MALQLIESYVVTPLIQQRQVSLPPALLIAFQVVMGVLFGFLGAAVASPLLAAAKIGIEESYVKDILESESVDD